MALSAPMKILGILNITADSFSDGGKYLEPEAAIAHAAGAGASGRRHHRYRRGLVPIPMRRPVAPEVEIARLASRWCRS